MRARLLKQALNTEPLTGAAKNKPGANWLHRVHCGDGVHVRAAGVKVCSAVRRLGYTVILGAYSLAGLRLLLQQLSQSWRV